MQHARPKPCSAHGGAGAATSDVLLLDPSTSAPFLADVDTMLFDCDGVLWKGSMVVPGTPEALRALRAQGKRLLFVTNNASKPRSAYAAKFTSLGLDVAVTEVVSASYAAAAYLTSIGFSKKVLLLGNSGVEQELTEAGIEWIGGEAMVLPHMGEMDAIASFQPDPEIGAVVVGWDPHFDFSRLVYASVCLRELPGCIFVATNTDCADTLGGLRMMPGTGGLVAAVQVASGVAPIVVGKEGPWLLGHLREKYGLIPDRAAIVGDRLDTDIAMVIPLRAVYRSEPDFPFPRKPPHTWWERAWSGRAGGLTTVLALTGIASMDDARRAAAVGEGPDAAVASVAQLAGLSGY
ncbi:hypothetical protein FOA52_009704 [Chlamydomonas sp. UWO 241]|nr:hypothetical protein FOA52_009704 [Chlamydomonas sp. UWO 241]